VIDLSKLPIYYPVNGLVASKRFIATNRDAARNFLKSWVEGIKSFKTDEDLALKVIGKYLKITERDLLKKSWEIYQPAYKKIPYGDERAVKFALAQMAAEMPEAAQRRAENFIDNSLLAELEKSGAIDQMYSHK
jgi:NitT/TauT family transport system substrate-binding protein